MPFADSTGHIVNKFEQVWGVDGVPVQWGPSWASLNMSEECRALYRAPMDKHMTENITFAIPLVGGKDNKPKSV